MRRASNGLTASVVVLDIVNAATDRAMPRVPDNDPTIAFKVIASDLANAFRGIAKRDDVLPAREAVDLVTAADAIERALKHLRPGALAMAAEE